MGLIEDEFADISDSNLMENYVEVERGQLEVNHSLSDGGGVTGNYSVLPDPFGSEPTLQESPDYVPYNLRPETYIIPVVFAIIFIIGVIGNGTLIVIFLKHRSMRNVPNMSIWTSVGARYICSLAIGDLVLVLFAVPFTSTVYTVESWPYGEVVCKFSEFIKDLSIGVSVFTLTALSADRYFAIKDPMRKLTGRRATRITCITIIGIWVISIIFALPSLIFSFVWTVEVPNSNSTFDVCYPYPKELTEAYGYPKLVVMWKFLVYYAIPLCFIATFYIVMAHHLILSTRNMVGEAQGQLKQIQSRKKVAKMVLSFVVIFAVCFFPNHFFYLWFYYNPSAEQDYNLFWHSFRMVGFCLSFINSCINPITLYCVSGTFRKHFNRHLFCCCLTEQRSRHHHNHFLRGAPSGYHSGVSHTDHIYADRIKTNGGTQFSRASTMNKMVIPGGNRSRQNSQQLQLPPLGNNNGSTRSQQASPNGNGKAYMGNCDGEIEMVARKSGKKQRLLSAVEESEKFDLIRIQQHATNGAGYGESDEAEQALLGGGSGRAEIINHQSGISTSCM